MDLRVYEGYKQTSTSNVTQVKQTAQTLSSFSQAFKTPGAQAITRNNTKPRIAMFIDVDNAGISRENLLEIIFYANGKYQIDQCLLYGFSDETLPGIREIAAEYNVTTIGKMKFKQNGVKCLDSRLLIDAYECALNNRQKIDMVFLWCYPCDLAELFEKIRDLGVNTATIDNDIFDCKNKFVSQTFKLYSPYNFTLEQSTYGKVRNQATEIKPNENIEKTISEPEPVKNETDINSESKTEPVADSKHVEQPAATAEPVKEEPQTEPENDAKQDSQPGMFDEGFVPPVLPRRTVLERSNPAQKKTAEPKSEDQEAPENDKPSSLVEEIARKLNLSLPSEEEIAEEEAQQEKRNEEQSDFIMDLLKKAGFNNGDKNALKYEDTIGDL